jgi:hypothetical protein
MSKLLRALPDLVWSFFSVFFLVLVLSLFGKADQLATRSDLVLGASVLFAEGWWKVRTARTSIYRAFFELVGFLGAAVAVFFSSVMLFTEIGSIRELTSVTSSVRFASFQLWIELASVVYALLVRVILVTDKDIQDEITKNLSVNKVDLHRHLPKHDNGSGQMV